MVFKVSVSKDSPFTFANVPFGVISTKENPRPRCATAIGDYTLDLQLYWRYALTNKIQPFPTSGEELLTIFSQPFLNDFAAISSQRRTSVRKHLIEALRNSLVPEECFVKLEDVKMHLPMKIGGYSDFFCSLEHCQNCSRMTGGTKPNFYHAPSVYNGRASSIIPSGTSIHRPKIVSWDTGKGSGDYPVYGPSKKMDFELEMGYFVSKEVRFGERLGIQDAKEHIFGFVLLNDWSARDVQGFEMPPLGPFHSKGFGTSISPWIITLDALAPFAASPKHNHTSSTLPHLQDQDAKTGTFSIDLTASLIRNKKSHQITRSNLSWLYWTPYQQLTHHASAGCGMQTGDLCGTGTISGDHEGSLGCLFEATMDGTQQMKFKEAELGYLEDGDEIVLEGWCKGDERVGFGTCRGVLLPAKE